MPSGLNNFVEFCCGVTGPGCTHQAFNREDDPYCFKRFFTSLYPLIRGLEIVLLFGLILSGERDFCFDDSNTTNDDDDNVKKFTNVAKDITFYTVCIEVGLGYLTLLGFIVKFSCCTRGVSCGFALGGLSRNRCLCCFHSELYMEKFRKAISPFLIIDAMLFMLMGPIGNIHPFVVTCITGYIFTGFRLAAYVMTFIVFFSFRYYKYNEFEFKRVISLIFDCVMLFLVLSSVSSSLATLITLGIPEMKSIRITYAVATFVVVIIAYIKYYTAIFAIIIETGDKKTKCTEICNEVMNHVTFWIKLLFGDIVLIVLNTIIWSQHYEEDFKYAGLSLILTVCSTLVGIAKYVFISPFCQNDPLYKLIGNKLKKVCGCDKEESSLIN